MTFRRRGNRRGTAGVRACTGAAAVLALGAALLTFGSDVASATGPSTVTPTVGVSGFGDATSYGAPSQVNAPLVGIAGTPDGKGYWLAASDGGVFTFGDAGFFGSAGNIALYRPIVG